METNFYVFILDMFRNYLLGFGPHYTLGNADVHLLYILLSRISTRMTRDKR